MTTLRGTWRVLTNIVLMPDYVMGTEATTLSDDAKEDTQRVAPGVRYTRSTSAEAQNSLNN